MSSSIMTLDLTAEQIELALVALHVLDQVNAGSTDPVDELLRKSTWLYSIKLSASDLTHPIGTLSDKLWEPLYESRITPAQRLREVNVDDLSDEEAAAIVRGIEAQYGTITPDDFERTFAS